MMTSISGFAPETVSRIVSTVRPLRGMELRDMAQRELHVLKPSSVRAFIID